MTTDQLDLVFPADLYHSWHIRDLDAASITPSAFIETLQYCTIRTYGFTGHVAGLPCSILKADGITIT